MKTIKPEIPAAGIMKTSDYGDSKYYRISCQCGQPSDDIILNVDVDDHGITVHTWTTVKTCWWKERFNTFDSIHNPLIYTLKRIANDAINRTTVIWQVLTKGYIEMEAWTMMDKQQALNFAHTLETAIADVDQFRNDRKTKETPTLLKPDNVDDVLTDTYKV